MLIFRLFFILADKISRIAKSWLPIQNLNSVARSEIPYLNWRYDFVRFSHNFCENAWTSSLCTHPNNGVFWISTVVMRTRNTQVSFHNINSWISSILEIPACKFSFNRITTQRIWSKFLVIRNYFFLWISTLECPNQKTELDGMFIFWCWFFDFFHFGR